MTPTIDDIEAALPHVPAGLHCGDLTEADDRRAFAVTLLPIVTKAVKASQTAPGTPESDELGADGTEVQGNQDGRNNGVSSWDGRSPAYSLTVPFEWGPDAVRLTSWPPPKPGTHESDLEYDWKRLTAATLPGEHPYWGRGGISEAGKAAQWSHEENAR